MKTPVLNWKHLVSSLTILGFTVLIFLVLLAVPTSAADFEIGTQFGLSHLVPSVDDDYSVSVTYTRVPSGAFFDISSTPTSIYATWFLGKHVAIGPEFSFGSTSFSDNTEDFEDASGAENPNITSLYLGGRVAYFLRNHTMSSPYVLGRVSTATFGGTAPLFLDGNVTVIGFGAGLGYQWRIGQAFVLRTEGQYHRMSMSLEDDFSSENETANEFSFIIGLGTRFGKQ